MRQAWSQLRATAMQNRRRTRNINRRRMAMSAVKHLCLGAVFCALPGIASAAPLTVVDVAAAEIDCVFEAGCTAVSPEIYSDFIEVPGSTGTARLRSQTFTGKPGTAAEGKTAYEYRLDMTEAAAVGDNACVTDLHVDFGAVAKLRYDSGGTAGDVFVVAKGGLGAIGLSSAVQNGDVITFTFEKPICAADASYPGQMSFMFGLASSSAPKVIPAKAGIPGTGHVDVRARVPIH
jgi:hypothetical protein